MTTAGLREIFLEAVRFGEDNHLTFVGVPRTQFLGGFPREDRYLLGEFL